MSFEFKITGDTAIFSFDRLVKQHICDKLIVMDNGECQVESPFGKGPLVTGVIKEVCVLPSLVHGAFKNASWLVEVPVALLLPEDVAELPKYNPSFTYLISEVIVDKFTFGRSFRLSLVSPTLYEHFSNYHLPPVDKASSTWDHKLSVEELLFNRPRVFIRRGFKELPWAEDSLDGASILIPTSKVKENGYRDYTELGLAEDGWTYSGDLSSDDKYPELVTKQAMDTVRAEIVSLAHNP